MIATVIRQLEKRYGTRAAFSTVTLKGRPQNKKKGDGERVAGDLARDILKLLGHTEPDPDDEEEYENGYDSKYAAVREELATWLYTAAEGDILQLCADITETDARSDTLIIKSGRKVTSKFLALQTTFSAQMTEEPDEDDEDPGENRTFLDDDEDDEDDEDEKPRRRNRHGRH